MALRLSDLTPGFGAEVVGFDPAAALDDATIGLLRNAFDERGLLLLRDLDLTLDDQRRLVRLLARDPDGDGAAGGPSYVSNREPGAIAPFGRLTFHTDMMWADPTFATLSLYATRVEAPVVPTVFTSTVNGWDTLPDELRSRVEGLEVRHLTEQRAATDDDDRIKVSFEQTQSTTTPIGHRHRRTGRTMLYVSELWTREVLGLPPEEGTALLDALRDHLYRPQVLWTHEWRERDLLVWDNLAVQHARGNVEVEGPVRTLRKVMSAAPLAVGAADLRYSAMR